MATKTKHLTIEEMERQVTEAREAAMARYRGLLAQPDADAGEIEEAARVVGRADRVDEDRAAVRRAAECQRKLDEQSKIDKARAKLSAELEALDYNSPQRVHERAVAALETKIAENTRESDALDRFGRELHELREAHAELFDDEPPTEPAAPRQTEWPELQPGVHKVPAVQHDWQPGIGTPRAVS
ncbi:MAG: hypothetical protein WD768_07785 [Phycisphaeraceae bacterium]